VSCERFSNDARWHDVKFIVVATRTHAYNDGEIGYRNSIYCYLLVRRKFKRDILVPQARLYAELQ
jgi:hypothetical protein